MPTKNLPWCTCTKQRDGSWRPVGGSWKIGTEGGTHRAVMLSEYTGLVGIDIDNKSGKNGFQSLKSAGVTIPESGPRCSTPNSGKHLLFKRPKDFNDRNCEPLPGVEVKANGAFVMDGPGYVYEEGSLRELPKKYAEVVKKHLSDRSKRSHAKKVPDEIDPGDRHKTLFSVAGSLQRRGVGAGVIFTTLREINKSCTPPLPDKELDKMAKGVSRYTPAQQLRLSEAGAADLFAEVYHNKVRFDHDIDVWYIWDGRRWKPDKEKVIYSLINNVISIYTITASNTKGMSDDERKAMNQFSRKLEQYVTIKNVLELAKGHRLLRVSSNPWDQDNFKINVGNGFIDLRNGYTLHDHNQDEMMSRIVNINFQARASCPEWDAFLGKIQPRPSIRHFLQRWVGYCLSGDTSEQVFVFFYGSGANGKSVFENVLEIILGDYYVRLRSETLAQKGPRDDLIYLRGARVATGTEIEKGSQLAEGLVKDLTGGNLVNARPLYKHTVKFPPTHKLILIGNHKPVIRDNSPALWRRVLMVPFDVRIESRDRVPMLELVNRFRREKSGILNWALEGSLEYQKRGLDPPQPVLASVKQYQFESDVVHDFLDNVLLKNKRDNNVYEFPFKDVYEQYVEWAGKEDKKVLGKRVFKRGLEEIGVVFVKRKRGIFLRVEKKNREN